MALRIQTTDPRICSDLPLARSSHFRRWRDHEVASQGRERIMNATTTVKGVGGDKLTATINMSDANRIRYLRVALVAVGLIFVFGIYALGIVWPSGWTWGHGHSHYLMMILGVYATLGVFLLIASRNPLAHTSLIWFTVWSSVVHAVIMAVQALTDGAERGHLIADVPALLVVAIVLAALTPRAGRA
jgi:hypothetical protein